MDAIHTRKTRLGELLVQRGFLSGTQLAIVLDHQKTQTPDKPLGELCVEMGFISKGALNGVFEKYQRQILLGDLFLNLGIVSVYHLHEALEDQKKTKKRLGQILMEKRFITKDQLTDALSAQHPARHPKSHTECRRCGEVPAGEGNTHLLSKK